MKKVSLDSGHWETEDYTQRVTLEELQQIFLNKQEYINVAGHSRWLGYRKVAPRVYEIFKKPYV
jgi:hypothetical protein